MIENGVSVAVRDGVATITLARPPHNFFDVAMISKIGDVIEACDVDAGVRVCLLVSETKTFCAGADFSGNKRPDPRPIYAAALRLVGHRKPLIAAIGGAAVGGGLGLALTADIRVGGDGCWFHANFAKIGLSPGFGLSHTLPRLVGEHRANELFITGRRVLGDEALAIGLIDRLVKADELRGAAAALASEIAANSPAGLWATRKLSVEFAKAKFAAAIESELAVQLPLFSSRDFSEGVTAAQERRPPIFEDLLEERP